jgi:acetyltransferase
MDETQVHIRIARPDDTDAVAAFLAGLSRDTTYRRFLSPLVWLSPGLLRNLVTPSRRKLVLLALDGDAVVGHAMAVCTGGDTVDVAVVVADDHQHTGIGHRLMTELLDTVARAGATHVHSDVLSENRVVLDWLRRLLPDVRFAASGPTVEADGHLTPAPAVAA